MKSQIITFTGCIDSDGEANGYHDLFRPLFISGCYSMHTAVRGVIRLCETCWVEHYFDTNEWASLFEWEGYTIEEFPSGSYVKITGRMVTTPKGLPYEEKFVFETIEHTRRPGD